MEKLLVCGLTLISAAIGLRLARVPDGVVVERRGEVRVIQAMIHTFIEIDTHPVKNLTKEYVRLAEHIWAEATIGRKRGLFHDKTIEELIGWRTRRLKEGVSTRNRKKRGLFDFVGHLGKGLFGLTTQEDLSRLEEGLRVQENNQGRIVETQKGLVTIVRNLRTVVHNHTRTLKVLADYAFRMQGNQKGLQGRLYAMAELVELEGLLSGLEVLRMEEERGSDTAYLQLSLCQMGKVTTQLLPTNFIMSLDQYGKQGEALSYQ